LFIIFPNEPKNGSFDATFPAFSLSHTFTIQEKKHVTLVTGQCTTPSARKPSICHPKSQWKSGMNLITRSTLQLGFAEPGCWFMANG